MKLEISGKKVKETYQFVDSEFGLQNVPKPNLIFGEGYFLQGVPEYVDSSLYNEPTQVLILCPYDLLTRDLYYQHGFSFEDVAMDNLATFYAIHVYSYLNGYQLNSKMEDGTRVLHATNIKEIPETRAAAFIALARHEAIFGWINERYLQVIGKEFFNSILSQIEGRKLITPSFVKDEKLRYLLGTELKYFYNIKTTEEFRRLAMIPFDEVSEEEIARMKKLIV